MCNQKIQNYLPQVTAHQDQVVYASPGSTMEVYRLNEDNSRVNNYNFEDDSGHTIVVRITDGKGN